ncbi:hypothetical protein [Argonema antarcticum]|uniref:hypothetical protein n=1 Tax=Argonema antarcticum TaxID=2942763 RepID=UPI0020136C21|nr:hypothetical protein [Argonema antarcticum]MCL1475927.1 hypothetical protein [Argonema antarcticum A004/B2]
MPTYRPLIIVKNFYLADLQTLQEHSNVKHILEMPYNYVFFEFYDPIFELLYNEDIEIQNKAGKDPELQSKAKQLFGELDRFLQPLYSHPASHDRFGYRFGCIALDFIINKKIYTLKEPGNPKAIEIVETGFTNSTSVQLKVKFKNKANKNQLRYEQVIIDWHEWAKKHFEFDVLGKIEYQNKLSTITIYFPSNFENFMAAIIVMLNDTRKETSIYWLSWDCI